LEKLSGGVECLIIRLTLYWWKDWMEEARHDVLDGGVLHFDVGRPECLVDMLEKRRFSVRRPKKTVVLLASYSYLWICFSNV
jgi:hypothetical protein